MDCSASPLLKETRVREPKPNNIPSASGSALFSHVPRPPPPPPVPFRSVPLRRGEWAEYPRQGKEDTTLKSLARVTGSGYTAEERARLPSASGC